MTKSLSLAAAAVWEAFERADCDPYVVDPREAGLAAALRAAAQFNPGPFVPELFGEGWYAAMGELRNIADELEPKDKEALDD
jgi:hypothetical protein